MTDLTDNGRQIFYFMHLVLCFIPKFFAHYFTYDWDVTKISNRRLSLFLKLKWLIQERAMVTIKPTKKGLKEIGEEHELYTMKYLRQKPVRTFQAGVYKVPFQFCRGRENIKL